MALRRRTRGLIYRGTMYALFIAVVVLIIAMTDWQTIGKQFFNLEVAAKLFPDIIIVALRNTILFTLIAFTGGLLLGILFALMKLSVIAPFRWFATGWIELFRGLPALLTIFAMAFILPIAFGIKPPGGPVGAGLIGLILVASAYMAEVIRSGIQAVPKGQTEASRSLGMSPMKTMFWVVLPQGFRIIIPPLTNEFVLLLKDTSLLFIAGTFLWSKELTTFARDANTTYANATPLIMAAILYLMVTIPLTRFTAWLERRMARER
ncbi:amino acid ABC transporter permease [Microbacterium esteraromaticum]|uniref:Amino acid ABC transporter permease n=1 Tax=Microbacterium esteraromaticum TaxID=57043 RepID=A0A939ISJ9_9MICO|nr:amino acid ABC transporter permease [Microbacterium esteraromaticum]MBN8205252.1 amino acid ABC transporter permease [Microbacterium esteraromaticum]MBN8415406.1 amino acid ABC transporter permease [Microbacterium esteraromaticum]MBN8424245.1 amino acid ABC transporter permease [Microbacterium esteraromaticum]MCA1305399.1 amino acid ABC transporter permease [Microbacterium esteraromaticum]